MASVNEEDQRKQLETVLRQIVFFDRKNFDKKQYISACDHFRKSIINMNIISKPDFEWQDVVKKLLSILPNKNLGTDVRKYVADCIGTVGFVLFGKFSEFVEFVFAAFNKASQKYFEERSMILHAICTSLELYGNSTLLLPNLKPIEEIMKTVKKILDSNESHVVLTPLLNICLTVAKYFPAVFRSEFLDILDFTVGWYIELNQPPEVAEKCNQVLMELRTYFHQAVQPSVELMTQFVDDAKVYIKKLHQTEQTEVESEVALQKTALLLRSLATILNVFNSPDVLPYLLPFAKKPSELESSVKNMMVIINHPACSIKTLSKVLDFFDKVVDVLPPEMASGVIPLIFSSIVQSRYKYCSITGQFLTHLLTPRALPTLQAAYKCTKDKLLECLERLNLAEEEGDIDPQHVEEEAIFYIRTLSTVAGAKNSLLGIMGLTPSIFCLLADKTPLTEKLFISRYPACHLSLLYVLKLHCERHENFISNSAWFIEKKHSIIMQESQTSAYFARIVTLLSDLLLLNGFMWSDTREIVLEWIRGIAFGTSHEMLQQILGFPQVIVLRKALLRSFLCQSRDKKVSLESPRRSIGVAATRVRQYTLLRRLAVFDLVQDDIINGDFVFLCDVFKTVKTCSREMAIGLWQTIPPPFFIQCGLSQLFKEGFEVQQPKIMSSTFTADHFKLVTDLLLNSIVPTYLLNDCYDSKWIEDVTAIIYSFATGEYGIEIDHIGKWRWALAQTAQYCIDNRMKTPLGKPLETFLCFEKEMRRLAVSALSQEVGNTTDCNFRDAKVETEEAVGSKAVVVAKNQRCLCEDEEDEVDKSEEQRHLSDAESWWRVRSFLETMELLDKLITYASDGTVFQLCRVSQPSRQFFVTNAASCSSWLSRMYLITMAVAYHNGNFAQVIRLGQCVLHDAQKRSKSPPLTDKSGNDGETEGKTKIDGTVLTCVSWMVRAFVELGGRQGIYGLYSWIKKCYGVSYHWIVHAANIASGRIEIGLDGLIQCAAEEGLPEIASKTIRHLILTGLTMLRSTEELKHVWKNLGDKNCSFNSQSCKAPKGFEEVAWERMKSLVNFVPLPEAKGNSLVWDMDGRFHCMESKLMEFARSFNKSGRIDLMRRLGEDAHMLMLADTSTRLIVKASVLHVLASNLKEGHKTDPVFLSDTTDMVPLYSSQGSAVSSLIICQQLGQWMESCHLECDVGPCLKIVSDEPLFYLNACNLARRLGNIRSANRHMQSYRLRFQSNSKILPSQNGWAPSFEKEGVANVMNWMFPFNNSSEDQNGLKLLSGRIASKLLYAEGLLHGNSSLCNAAFAMLYNSLSDEIDRLLFKSNALYNGTPTVAPNALAVILSHQLKALEDAKQSNGIMTSKNYFNYKQYKKDYSNMLSRSILKLAEWLEREPSLINVALARSSRISWHLFGVELSNLPPPLNPASGLIGSLLSASCKLSFGLAKAHARFADWAYKCVHSSKDESDVLMSFTDDEKSAIVWHMKSVLPSVDKDICETVVEVASKAETLVMLKDDVSNCLGKMFTKEVVHEKLFGVDSVLFEVWSAAKQRTVAYVVSCVRSYFNFIAECGKNSCYDAANYQGTIGTVIACLRVIQLFMKYSETLQTIVDDEFLKTDVLVWKDILPQIFARLNHPLSSVRNSLCTLLERIAEKSPHALCYPAIVGATKSFVIVPEGVSEKSDELEEEFVDAERKMKVEAERSLMYDCCQRLVKHLSRIFPDLVANVSEFVQELQHINMLFEERWIFVLANLDHEMSRRIAQIETEKARTLSLTHISPKEQQAIIKEKSVIMSEMVFHILEALYERTCVREVTTANERHFRDLYYTQISAAFQNFKLSKQEPRKAWQPFKQLLVTLTQRSSKRGALSLATADIAPHLCAMRDTKIPLPGQELKEFSEVVTVSQITKQAVILPTKTRPKKISFVGSDGKEYPFLFKGQEDLHLDERIMQLLRICNLMLQENEKEWPLYSARHYSVTPLGSRSGLIQWVDGATPLFHVYRKWQNRKATNNNGKKDAIEVDRPSELFFKKLKAAFNANNLSSEVLADRQKWPLPILEKVVLDLMKETPRDLLSRELWIRAGSSDSWYRTTERFARSTAVMSVLGSILGLGDRHLDNVLVNLDSGQVIHIDYNVCFDKGRHLRVPETVPFRLTNNIVYALGPTQIEGTFRLSCEHMLKRLRAGKEVFLTLLDTFVYDPLVDWAAAQEQLITSGSIGVATLLAVYGKFYCLYLGTEPYPGTALPLTYSLFDLRVREFEKPWRANGDRLHYALLRMIEALEKAHRSREGILDYGSMVKGKALDEGGTRVIEKERMEASYELKRAITEHKHLMHDFRPIIRTLAYSDERFREYLRMYKDVFMAPLLEGCKVFEEGDVENFGSVATLFQSVNYYLDSIYDRLIALKGKDEKGVPNASRINFNGHVSEGKSNLKKQEENVCAKNVSLHVKLKLEGKDESLHVNCVTSHVSPECVGEKEALSFAEQIDIWIQQATNLSNLALMYEGWTAWV
uniref:non-specific serine/threonine protein kinase n=1 Tax=Syphacia muris TaxID=451379 RepID=A0A158R632_9BILA